jgi:predicted acetyltransferase
MEDNFGSKKIIEANGGVFIQEALVPAESKKMLKYKIPLM